jgi:hypothetical protein
LRNSIPNVSSADEIAVVDLTGLRIDARNFVTDAVNAPTVRVAGNDLNQIIRLWQKVPADEPMRCHNPPFGLRFYLSGAIICQGSICWQCNNIYGESNGAPFYYNFGGRSRQGQNLLKLLEQIVGHSAVE